jgi:cobalt-precorrin-5B (C1)-methyltransferase
MGREVDRTDGAEAARSTTIKNGPAGDDVPLVDSLSTAAPPGGYTIPVWLAAAARAAVGVLHGEAFDPLRPLELLEPPGVRPVAVRAAALMEEGKALAEAVCDPGEGLDLTRGLVIWVLAWWGPAGSMDADPQSSWLVLEAGEGVGVQAASGDVSLSGYARRLLEANLRLLVPPGGTLHLRVVLPAGRALAQRTSNEAFGVVNGLALIGTQAEVQAGAGPDQLRSTLEALSLRAAAPDFGGDLVLVIGENGLDLAPRLGLPPALLLKAGNWVGPVLVASAEQGVKRLLLFGYQGKLLKLAGGIFHTHHHLADARAEILTALAALEGVVGAELEALHAAPTVEAALAGLEVTDPVRTEVLRRRVAVAIERRSAEALARHGAPSMEVGAVLFDRARRIRAAGPVGASLMEAFRGAT